MHYGSGFGSANAKSCGSCGSSSDSDSDSPILQLSTVCEIFVVVNSAQSANQVSLMALIVVYNEKCGGSRAY
jgi:hypothetical protein